MVAAPDPTPEGASVLSLELGTQALPAGTNVLAWHGLAGSARALALALAARARPLVIIAGTPIEADRLAAELRFFADADLPVLFFPGNETLAYDPFSPHPDITSQRLATLASLPALTRGVVVTPLDALQGRLPPAPYVAGHTLLLETGMQLDAAAFRERLVAAGYAHVPQVATHGEFAVRGSIIDLYPMGAAHPFRLDLFDDRLDSVRAFDAETQRSGDRMASVRLLPAREFPLDEEGIRLFRRRWRARFEGDPSRSPVYRAVGEGRAPAGIEAWLPLFFERTGSFFDYLPPGACLVDASADPTAAATLWSGITERHEDLRHDLERPLLRPGELFIDPEELAGLLAREPRIALLPVPAATATAEGVGVRGALFHRLTCHAHNISFRWFPNRCDAPTIGPIGRSR